MSRSFSQRMSGIVMTAVIFAGVVSLALLGDYAYFGQTKATIDTASGWFAVIFCGSAGGMLAAL